MSGVGDVFKASNTHQTRRLQGGATSPARATASPPAIITASQRNQTEYFDLSYPSDGPEPVLTKENGLYSTHASDC